MFMLQFLSRGASLSMTPSILLNDDRSEKVCYTSPGYPIYIRRGLLSLYPDYRAPNHWHHDVELICILSGQMQYNINGEIVTMKSGEGIFVNSGQMHFGFSDTESECDFLCILFHPLLLCSMYPFENDFILPLIRNSRMPYSLLFPENDWQEEILSLLRRLFSENEEADNPVPLFALSAIARIWGILCEHAPEDTETDPVQSQDLVIMKNMVGFIQKNYRNKITLARIAAAGAVGQSKCCRLFSRYYSQTPGEYLTHYRLDKSVELLRNMDLSITEIALSVGFSNASYYAETFRKWMKISPSEMRKEWRKTTEYEKVQG